MGDDVGAWMSPPLWDGRFTERPHADMMRFTRSIDADIRLLEHDLAATRAHARALAGTHLLSTRDVTEVDRACDQIADEVRSGALAPAEGDEDVHGFVERELTERLGETGARIHAGRSRNDLVACDLRLWCRGEARGLRDDVGGLVAVLMHRAREHATTVMPGYTHLQRAQPVSLGFHLVAHAFALARDLDRFEWARRSSDVSPLGAGALAGSTLDLDPSIAADELSFSGHFDNAMDAVSDRDFAAELVFACAICGIHLSRLAEEIVLWCSAEWCFARLPDAWSTGSSMMPQKRNPDVAELVRGRSATVIGQLAGLLAMLKGLPLAYDRDLQEDKGFVFTAVDILRGCVAAMRGLVDAIDFDTARMAEAAERSSSWATDVAESLVVRGIPFRDAHRATGRAVQATEASVGDGPRPAAVVVELDADRVEKVSVPTPSESVTARSGPGGPSPERLAEQLTALEERLRRHGMRGL